MSLATPALLLTVLGVSSVQEELVEKLPAPHRKWLEEEVPYIITGVERERFLSLERVEERDAFIEAFWRKRDENPATEENEYREEHYKRLAYANEFLGRDTFRPGWMTDRGRYHILLGPPSEQQDYVSQDAVYPSELWFYNKPELKRYGLPPFFYLLFFSRHGGGEKKLYSPLGDGPQALLTGYQTSSMDFRSDIERAYNKLFEISPELAQASISFRTDEGDIVQFQSPSFGTISLLDTIVAAPFRGVDTSYAENFDVEKGLVESDYLFSYVPSSGAAHVVPGASGHSFVHWTIEIDSKHLALVKDEDRGILATTFLVSAQVSQRSEPHLTVVDSRKESFMNFQESEVQAVLRSPFAYNGTIPVVPGSYDLRVVLRNRACSGREASSCRKSYTLFDAPIEVPAAADKSRLSDVVVAYGSEERLARTDRAYEFESRQLFPNPTRIFASSEPLLALVRAMGVAPGMSVDFRIVHREDGSPVSQARPIPVEPSSASAIQEFALDGVAPGYYRLEAKLLGPDGAALDERASNFDITPRNAVPRPGIRGYWAEAAADVPGMVEAALASQHLNLGEREQARALFEDALEKNPRLGVPREALAYLAIEDGNVERVIELLEPVYAQVQNRFEILALLGEAYVKKKDYARGAELLEKAIALRRPEPPLLNLLAVSHYQMGNRDRARELLSRSLAENPDQPSIRELVEQLEKEPS